MVRIRLRRVGSAHQPHYRVVIADKESPRDGRFLEIVGHYNPKTNPSTIHFDEEKIYHWSQGARPDGAETVQNRQAGRALSASEIRRGKATLLAEAENIYKNRVKDPSTALTKE